MTYQIMPIAEDHITGFRTTLDAVAREQKYLSFLEGPSLERVRVFVLNNIKENYPHFVVCSDGEVVGWCEIIPDRMPVSAHRGVLGIGLLPQFRGQGIGRELMQRTIDAGRRFGLTRIELTVRESNVSAIALYERLGFRIEGLHQNTLRINGRYENQFSMALVTE
jgi:ribosomal protein S18 acetylase RimI-like enzyme